MSFKEKNPELAQEIYNYFNNPPKDSSLKCVEEPERTKNISYKEAIEELQPLYKTLCLGGTGRALKLALSVLEERAAHSEVRKNKHGGYQFNADVQEVKWISVDDRLPKDEQEVLVCTKSKNGMRNIDKGYLAKDRFVHRGCAEVTHWMPLPELPEEKEGD